MNKTAPEATLVTRRDDLKDHDRRAASGSVAVSLTEFRL